MKFRSLRRYWIPLATLAVAALGAVVPLIPPLAGARNSIWLAGLVITSAPLLWTTLRGAMRGNFAADLVASFAVIASIALNQPLVGLVIVLMQSGGETLERIAEGRATDALRALQEAAPSIVHRMVGSSANDVPVDSVVQGDTILVRPGEMIPCDGTVVRGESHLDTASLTGEPAPVAVTSGSAVMSGSINVEGPLVILVLHVAAESQYAKIVALVREAQSSKAPLQRIADKYAVLFTPVTLIVCGVAYAISGDWGRVLAVLAIATPCPLILATPVAILGGMNRSARHQILIRTGGAIEALGSATAVLFDKTGTITIGRPEVSQVIPAGTIDENELLRLSAAVEQGSSHLLARTLVSEATQRGQSGSHAVSVVEYAGEGVEGQVEGKIVAIGGRAFVAGRYPSSSADIEQFEHADGEAAALRAYVAIDGVFAGVIEYADMIRPGIAAFVADLRAMGLRHIMLLSGDREENVKAMAIESGIDEWQGDMLPGDKVRVVKQLMSAGESVVMMGDGTNDAPALSTATVGVALASHGRGIATEAADVILLADDPSRLLAGIKISRRTMRVARQSIRYGLGISAVGMAFAAAGMIPPIAGAALQEAVDLAVIVNALRASRGNMYGKT